MASSSKRPVLPIMESPPAKRSRSSGGEALGGHSAAVSIDVVPGNVEVDLENHASHMSESNDPELPPYLSIWDIPNHFFTDAQHEPECNCPICALWRWQRKTLQKEALM